MEELDRRPLGGHDVGVRHRHLRHELIERRVGYDTQRPPGLGELLIAVHDHGGESDRRDGQSLRNMGREHAPHRG